MNINASTFTIIIAVGIALYFAWKSWKFKTIADHATEMQALFEIKYYKKCRIILDMLKNRTTMKHEQFLNLIESIAGRKLTGKEKLTIVEAMAKLALDQPVGENRRILKIQTDTGVIPCSREEYVRIKTKSLNERGFKITEKEVAEALAQVMVGFVHEPIHEDIAREIVL